MFCYVFLVIDGAALRIDDKLRVAKERREEQEKQHGDKAKKFTQQVLATLDVHVTVDLWIIGIRVIRAGE